MFDSKIYIRRATILILLVAGGCCAAAADTLQAAIDALEDRRRALSEDADWERARLERQIDEVRMALGSESTYGYSKIEYPSADGLMIPAHLFLPLAPSRAGGNPAVIYAHGGEHGRFRARSLPRVVAMVERGYVVLAPDYRGSAGYSQAFYEAADYGGLEIDDMLAARVFLAALPGVDPAQIGILGLSHGGYNAVMALARAPGQFAAAVDFFGPTDLVWRVTSSPDENPNAEPGDREKFARMVGASIEDAPELYRERSPRYVADRIVDPLLILHGDEDSVVLPQESQWLAAALERAENEQFAFHTIEGGKHGYPAAAMDEAWRLALDFLAHAFDAESAAAELSGDWHFDVESPNGPGRRDVLFLQEDRRVVGFIDSDSASGRFVGSLDGERLEFTAVLEFGGQPMAAEYTASVDGDTMTGKIEYGTYGTATFVGYRGRRPAESATTDAELVGSARGVGIDVSAVGDLFGETVGGVLAPEMVAVDGGEFRMGNDGPAVNPDFGEDFAAIHRVRVSAFGMSRFPVTNAQYLAFCEATGREPPLAPKGWDDYLRRYPNHPVVNVNHHDAEAYAEWLTTVRGVPHRLPTEAEWEYAARAGHDGQDYVFGDRWEIAGANTSVWRIGEIPDRVQWKTWWDREGNELSKSQPMTTRVGSFAPNRWGFYDMAGNVWEWTHDWYRADYYEISPPRDPMGPETGDEKVLRGCSWYNQPDVCFIATRDRYAPDVRLYYIGFRVVER